MSTTNWSAYRSLTDDEQVLFKNLLGKGLSIGEALLVSDLSSEKEFTEYIFLYNHPDPEVHNLVSFYAKVEDEKETLLQYSKAQLTEKMILKDVKLSADLTDEDYKLTSQATYFFDCENKATIGTNTPQINNINSITSKGSFCCILKKGTEYFILTAAHNLQNGTNKPYKLIKDESNYVDLELMKNYSPDHDAAILKITKITEDKKLIYDITDADKKNDNINNSLDFYSKTIKFKNNFYTNENEAKDKTGNLVGNVSKSGISEIFLYENSYNARNLNDFDNNRFFAITESGKDGDSGGVVFSDTENKLLGIYLGTFSSSDFKARCRQYYSLKEINTNYKIC